VEQHVDPPRLGTLVDAFGPNRSRAPTTASFVATSSNKAAPRPRLVCHSQDTLVHKRGAQEATAANLWAAAAAKLAGAARSPQADGYMKSSAPV
jgi:hypothetical protein